jgi:hypothetical protein
MQHNEDGSLKTCLLLPYVPEVMNLQEIRGRSFTCFLVNEVECPCMFGSRWKNLKENFTQIIREVQQIDLELVRQWCKLNLVLSHSQCPPDPIWNLRWTFDISNLDKGKRFISFPKLPDRLWGPRSPLYNGYWCLYPWVRQPRLEVNHYPPSTSEVKNEWIYTFSLPIFLPGMYRDNDPFTFTLRTHAT